MRFVYQQQFIKSNVALSDATIGFLPAHAASSISDEFAKRTTQGMSIRNVSDRPRNPKNKADEIEMEAIKYFSEHPKQNETIRLIKENNKELFFFSAPLKIEPHCLSCHGDKESTLEYIKTKYDNAFGYKLGDIRGLISIKIPAEPLTNPMMSIFWKTTFFAYGLSALLLTLVYAAIRRLTRREEQIKKELEESVEEKTSELQAAYKHEKHLSSILHTVASVNQILITTQNMDELIDRSAKTLSSNDSFASVKIALAIDGELVVKASYGLAHRTMITEVDRLVFESNKSIIFNDFKDESVPEYYKQKAKTYEIRAAYCLPLRSDAFATNPLGVITVCTAFEEGFSKEETVMIDELVGDIGFAVNSFIQKETIEGLMQDRLNNYQDFIGALVEMIEQRDAYTAGHTKRVAEYSLLIARKMGISESEAQKLVEAAKLHDIGKIVTPDSVLLKPGTLSALEYELIKEHVMAGYRALSSIGSYSELAQIVVHHHEKFDGSGYPYGKSGDEIPMLGYILAVADSFDAMTTNRIYKPRKNVKESLGELLSLSGSWYHPDVVSAALEALSNIEVDANIDQAIGANAIDKERLSYFFQDRLTRLYNEDYLTLMLSGRSIYAKPRALLIISLVNFTKYNKEHTWEGGNDLLVLFADFLTNNIKDTPIFRIWGDRFAIADFNGDIEALIKESPLGAHGVGYKAQKLKAPFEDIKETLLEA